MPRLGRSTPQPSAQSSVGFRWPIDCGSNLARGMLARHKGCARQRSCFRLPLALSITRNTGFFPLATDGTGVGRRCGREKPSGIDIASDPNPSFEYVQPAREVTKTERQKLSNDMSARSGRVRGTTTEIRKRCGVLPKARSRGWCWWVGVGWLLAGKCGASILTRFRETPARGWRFLGRERTGSLWSRTGRSGPSFSAIARRMRPTITIELILGDVRFVPSRNYQRNHVLSSTQTLELSRPRPAIGLANS